MAPLPLPKGGRGEDGGGWTWRQSLVGKVAGYVCYTTIKRFQKARAAASSNMAASSSRRVLVRHLAGLAPYAESLTVQRLLMGRRKAGTLADTLLLVEHSPVFTLGRLQDSADNLLASQAEVAARGATVVQSDRGGNITFHGPGQLVAYPILDLNGHRRNLRWYTSALEDVMIETAGSFGVRAERGPPGQTGVWVDDRKIGALGVRVSRWITSHGIALNCDTDLRYFDMMVPCGLAEKPAVTSLSAELAKRQGAPVDFAQVKPRFLQAFARVFECELEDAPGPPMEAYLAELQAAEDAAS